MAAAPTHHDVTSSTFSPASGSAVGSASGSVGAGRGRASIAPSCSPRRGDGLRCGQRLAVETVRTARAGQTVGTVEEHAARDHVLVAEDGLAVVHRRHRDPQRGRGLDDLLDLVMRHEAVDDLLPLDDVHVAAGEPREPRVVEQVGALDEHEEVLELGGGVGVEADEAVARPLDRRRLHAARRADGLGPAHAVVGEVAEHRTRDRHRLGEGQVDVLADARAAGTRGRDDHRGRAVQPAHVLGEATAGLHRVARRLAPEEQRARLRLHDEVGRDAVRQRAAGAERRDRQHHEVRVAGAHAVDVEVPGAEALDDDVGVAEQRVDVRVTRRADHRTLARAQVPEQRAALVERDVACLTRCTRGVDHRRAAPP